MAEEVGAAFVSLVPSARGFSTKARAEIRKAMAGNDIAVPVKPEVDRADVTRALTGATAGQRGGIDVDTRVDAGELRREVRTAVLATQATRPTVHVHVDVDRNTLRRAFTGLSGDFERGGSGLATTFGRAFIQNVVFSKVGLIAGLIGAFSIPGAALTAATTLFGTSLGAIFVGAFALRADPELKSAVSDLLGDLNKGLAKAAQPLKGPFLEAIGILKQSFKDIAPQVGEIFKAVAPFIKPLAEGIAGFIKAFTPGVLEAVKNSGPVINQIAMALPDLGNGLAQFLISMSKVSPQAGQFIGQFLRFVADVLRGLGGLIGFLTRLSDDFVTFLRTVGELVRETVLGWGIIFGKVKEEISRNISAVVHAIQGFIDKVKPTWDSFWKHIIPSSPSQGVAAVVTLAKGLPGRIKAAVGGLGDLLRQAGRNVVQGLIDGIKSKFGPLASTASSMAGIIRDYLPFSPAKEGPLSGSGNPYRSGQVIADMLAGGMRSGLPVVSAASDQLAGAVGAGGMNRGGSALAAAPTQVVISSDGGRFSDLLIEVLRGAVRDKGGNVQFALGTGRA